MAFGLRKKFGLFRWRKKRQEKGQDGPRTPDRDACFVLRPKQVERASSSTTAAPRPTTTAPSPVGMKTPTVSSTPLPASPSNIDDKAEETHVAATYTQEVATGVSPVSDTSLWDTAYDSLKKEEHDWVAEYEQLLSRVLVRVQSTSQLIANDTEDKAEVPNQIPQNSLIIRREKLKEITELGLKHVEDKKVSTTLLGHEIVLQDVVANVAGAVEWVESQVKDAIKDLPYASIVMAGVSLVLPLLKNPAATEEANRDGFIYVTSQMRYYTAMERLLLPPDMKRDLREDLTKRLVDLYELIIGFQVQSVIRLYRTRTKNFFRGAINYDNWAQKLQDIKGAEAALVARFETAIDAQRLHTLKNLGRETEQSRKVLNDILIKFDELVTICRDHLSFAQKMDQHMSAADDRTCLRDLQTTNPHRDKERIKDEKGGLLKDSYSWVLYNAEFQQLRNAGEGRLLWIKGDPGKGKTMLLCGIVDELIKLATHTTNISFFFCQATDKRINNATAVLRGLIWVLVKQQPSLISYVRKAYDNSGKTCFDDPNAWVTLSSMFTDILKDECLQDTYIIIDALDECVTGQSQLLTFIARVSAAHPNVKWVVSSRNWFSIEQGLNAAVQLSLELNEEFISAAVDRFVQFKVDELAKRNEYDSKTQDAVRHNLSSNANGTFLWVALVCQELATISGWEAEKMSTAFPPGLDALYERMMGQIRTERNCELCKNILAVVSAVYRPITLDELPALVSMHADLSDNDKALTEIVRRCGSFLSLRGRTVSFVHQSAKDFLTEKASKEIFPSGIQHIHDIILSQSLRVMANKLHRDIYCLGDPGHSIERVKKPSPDPLAVVRYSCTYWIDHLSECDPTRDEVNESIDRFLRRSYLHWLEALSLLRILSGGVIAIGRLEGLLGHDKRGQLTSFVRDAHRFALSYRWIIEQAPLQAYASALVFAPTGSLVKKIFKEEKPGWLSTGPVVEMQWNACTQTLEGHGDWVQSVAFSPDGQRVASGSHDNTIKIWDAASGTCTQTLEGHGDWVQSVAFSPDGQRVASGSHDNTIKIWDAASGTCTQTLEGHGDWVLSVAFSPDGQRVASGSRDKTIKIWDAASGTCINTNIGRIQIATATMESPNQLSNPLCNSYGLGQDHRWITCNNQNVLWLPPEYHASASAMQGRKMVLGCYSGRVVIFSFSRDV